MPTKAAETTEETRPAAELIDARIAALGQLARAGYRIGLTVAPIQPLDGWRDEYRTLFTDIAAELAGIAPLDLTAELITHRFTPKSKAVIQGWYPGTTLDLDEEQRRAGQMGLRKHRLHESPARQPGPGDRLVP